MQVIIVIDGGFEIGDLENFARMAGIRFSSHACIIRDCAKCLKCFRSMTVITKGPDTGSATVLEVLPNSDGTREPPILKAR
jgi:hypothetical protein